MYLIMPLPRSLGVLCCAMLCNGWVGGAGDSTWRVSSTLFGHIQSDQVKQAEGGSEHASIILCPHIVLCLCILALF